MKIYLFWIASIVITLTAAVYQRKTGPTYNKKVQVTIENQTYEFSLIRSHGGEADAELTLSVPDKKISGEIQYRLYPTKSAWIIIAMERDGENLTGYLPHLPPAGKYEYKITLFKNGNSYPLNENMPVVIRFKGDVPGFILVPHIFFMFFAMLLGNLAGIMAVFNYRKFGFYTNLTVIFLFTGGLILGPWVQWYAFGEAWAGVPFAWDLTDNKTLVAFIFWMLAFFMNRKKQRPVYTIVASVVMLVIFSIPHSMFGSQLDPETGEVIQGWIQLYF